MDRIDLNNVFKNIPGSVFWKDRNSVYLGCNKFQAKLANLASPEEVVGKTDYDLPWYESADILQANDRRVMESGAPEEFIEVTKLPDGRELVLFSRKSPLYDEKGDIIGIIGGALDITMLKKSEALKDSAREKFAQIYLNNILKNVPGSVFWKDRDGVFLGCNDFQAKMAGFNSPSEMIGKTNYDLPWYESADTLKATDERIMETGISEELMEVVKLADGTEPVMFSSKSPLYDDQGNVIGIIGTALDITELKEAEKQKELALEKAAIAQEKRKAEEETKRALMVLAGSIAHDLRTPLFCLRANNDILEKCLPVLLECYRYVQKSGVDIGIQLTGRFGEWIEKQIPDLLAESEQFITKMHTFIDDNLKAIKTSTSNDLATNDLVECKSYKEIDNALSIYPFQENERQLIEWERSYYFDFFGNPILFMRIMFNLLSNAIYQINKHGKGKIFISSEEQPEFNVIRFKDTAGGTSPDIVEQIFDGYKTTKAEGTGVGLAFCKLTMQSFGGDITCHSVEGDYIEFLLLFPKIKQNEI